MTTENNTTIHVPKVMEHYVPWGHYNDVEAIIKSGKFYPVWISGEAGTGKSVMIEQVCAKLDRKFIRVNFTSETDEFDLIGGLRLVDGSTTFQEGPVVQALREGAVLLLDEVSAAHPNKVLVLQSILEGKGVLIKSTNEYVEPAEGFQVFATCNTKGRGNDDGRYVGTSIMNGAFLDRWGANMLQEYPPVEIEEKILFSHWLKENPKKMTDKEETQCAKLVKKFVAWANQIRVDFEGEDGEQQGNFEETISTRSLIHMVKSYSIFKDEEKAIQMVTSRYDDETANSMLDIYNSMNEDFVIPEDEYSSDDGEYEEIIMTELKP